MAEKRVSELLDRMATIMAERGHFMAGRDKYDRGTVCLYQAVGITWRAMNPEETHPLWWQSPQPGMEHWMEHWMERAGARRVPDDGLLMKWSDNTDDETVILTIKRAAELARAAGQ